MNSDALKLAPTREPSAPSPHDVEWTWRHKVSHSKRTVTARTWFASRALAMAELGAGPDEVEQC